MGYNGCYGTFQITYWDYEGIHQPVPSLRPPPWRFFLVPPRLPGHGQIIQWMTIDHDVLQKIEINHVFLACPRRYLLKRSIWSHKFIGMLGKLKTMGIYKNGDTQKQMVYHGKSHSHVCSLTSKESLMWFKQCQRPPMTGNGKDGTYKHGDDWGMVFPHLVRVVRF